MADAWQNLMRCRALTEALCDTVDHLTSTKQRGAPMDKPGVLRLWALSEELGISTAWALCLDTATVRRELRSAAAAAA